MSDSTPPPQAPKPIPLVCAPHLLAGAEARAAAYPHFGYDWCIRFALRPIQPRKPATLADAARTERTLEYLTHRNRSAVR